MKWLKFINFTNSTYPAGQQLCLWIEIPRRWSALAIIDFMLTGPLLTVAIAMGLVGGVLCFITFYRSLTRLRIYFYLLALTVWDLVYILSSFFLYNLPTLIYMEISFFGPYSIAEPFLYYISSVARTGSIWTVLIIGCERYMALCHPFKLKSMNSQFRICFVLIMVAVLAFAYSSLRYFELYVSKCYEITTLQYVSYVTRTHLAVSTAYWVLYRVIGGSLFYSITPFVLLLLLTIRIIVEIKNSSLILSFKRKNSKNFHRRSTIKRFKDKTNRWMHVAMITKFLLCLTVPTVQDVWELIIPTVANSVTTSTTFMMVSHVSILLVTLNSSLNFYIYYATSQRFRKDCQKALYFYKRYFHSYSGNKRVIVHVAREDQNTNNDNKQRLPNKTSSNKNCPS